MTTNTASPAGDPGVPESLSPADRVMTAISILQAHALALDSPSDGRAMWGTFHMQSPAVEHAIHLLIEVLPDLETLT